MVYKWPGSKILATIRAERARLLILELLVLLERIGEHPINRIKELLP